MKKIKLWILETAYYFFAADLHLFTHGLSQGHGTKHENVSVLFATVPNFMSAFPNREISNREACLKILNEIIVEFDLVGYLLNFQIFLFFLKKMCVCIFS